MEKIILTLERGTRCTSWNFSGHRLAAGLVDGSLVVYDSTDPASSVFVSSSRFKALESSISKIVWIPPKYGDAVACLGADGSLSLWEEVMKDGEEHHWELCSCFNRNKSKVLDVQFGDDRTHLKLVTAHSDGEIQIFKLVDPLELDKWQLQAEFQNVIDLLSTFGNYLALSASISWNPQGRDVQESIFVVGFNSNSPSLNSPKVWEFDIDHQRWVPVAELSSPQDKETDLVFAVSWAPNIGRPYEVIAVATQNGISIWHLESNTDTEGRLFASKVAVLTGLGGEVWQMEWDMSGMTLATVGEGDGTVMLWQSDMNGTWREQASLQHPS